MIRKLFVTLVAAALLSGQCAAAITFLGKAEIPGTDTDLSGLTDTLEEGTPHNRLGGHGSGIAYTGRGNRYVMCADRGPADGATAYKCRLQFVDISVDRVGAEWRVEVKLVSTVMLTDPSGRPLVGASWAFEGGLRFDPEGVGMSVDGRVFVSDEYGPSILEFDHKGRASSCRIGVPEKFQINHPASSPSKELASNRKGRQPNRGMEGLTVSPDGRYVWGIMQSPLLQDGALDSEGNRAGVNVRMLGIDLRTGETREYVYVLDDPSYGISEILAVSESMFLVIERDGKAGSKARRKTVMRIDTSGAADISHVESLPSRQLPPEITPVKKHLFIDLLSAEYGLSGDSFPEKIEGLAFGPDLPDGRGLLLVSSDNDFVASRPTVILAFGVDREDIH